MYKKYSHNFSAHLTDLIKGPVLRYLINLQSISVVANL